MGSNNSSKVIQEKFSNSNEKSKKNIAELFIAPVITGIVISLLSFVVQYYLTQKQLDNTTYYNERNETYLESLNLINQYYQTLTIVSTDSSIVQFHKYDEVNLVYDKLLMLGVDKKIPMSFMNFFTNRTKLSPANKAKFINLISHDLYGKSVNVPYDSIAVTVDPSKLIHKKRQPL